MLKRYGPWATSINAGSSLQLSTFWRQRMMKLAPASQTSPVLSRRNLLCLGVAGAATALLPTIRIAEAMAGDAQADAQKGTAAPGHIYVSAVWIRGNGGPESAEGGIIAIDPESGSWQRITGGATAVRVSPDGKYLVYGKFVHAAGDKTDSRGNTFVVYDLEAKGETVFSQEDGSICWSPDANHIVISQRQTGTFRTGRDGWHRTCLPIPVSDSVADWSRNGRWFVTESVRDRPSKPGFQIYRMHPDGTEQVALTKEGQNVYPRFSPDSRRIVYCRDYSMSKRDVHEIRVIDVNGKNDHPILRNKGLEDFVGNACWSPDGRRLAVIWTTCEMHDGQRVWQAGEASKWRIEVMDADGRNRRVLKLADVRLLNLRGPDWR